MTTEDYLKLSKALATQVFFVADRASEIIREIVKENADNKGYLYIGNHGDLWNQDCKSQVIYIYADKYQVFIGAQAERYDECYDDDEDEPYECCECNLSDLNPFDRIEIADFLTEHF